VLLGLLMMVTRGNAVSQVIGFMSFENGLILAATGASSMFGIPDRVLANPSNRVLPSRLASSQPAG
jgi:hypothetical protein